MKINIKNFDGNNFSFENRIHIIGKNNSKKSTFSNAMRDFFSGQMKRVNYSVSIEYKMTKDLFRNKRIKQLRNSGFDIVVSDVIIIAPYGKINSRYKFTNERTGRSELISRSFLADLFEVFDFDIDKLSHSTNWVNETKEMQDFEKIVRHGLGTLVKELNKKYANKIKESLSISVDSFSSGKLVNFTGDITKNVPSYLGLDLKKKGVLGTFTLSNQGKADQKLISLSLHNNLKIRKDRIPVYILDEFDANFEDSRRRDFWKRYIPLLDGIIITTSHTPVSINSFTYPSSFLFMQKNLKKISIEKLSDTVPRYNEKTDYSFLFNDWTVFVEGKSDEIIYSHTLQKEANNKIVTMGGGSSNIDEYIIWKKKLQKVNYKMTFVMDVDVFFKIWNKIDPNKADPGNGLHRCFTQGGKRPMPQTTYNAVFNKNGTLPVKNYKLLDNKIFKKYGIHVHFGDLEKHYIYELKKTSVKAKELWFDHSIDYTVAKAKARKIIRENNSDVLRYAEKWLRSLK